MLVTESSEGCAQRDNNAESLQSQLIRNFEEDNEFAFHADEAESQKGDTDIMSARKVILTVQFWMSFRRTQWKPQETHREVGNSWGVKWQGHWDSQQGWIH